MIGDLHCHTRLSDGSMGLEEVIFYAKRGGLDFVGITDHDTLAGLSRACVLGQRYGIRIVGGVELSCMDMTRRRKVHILCYLPKRPDRMEGICKRTLESRTQAGKEMIRNVMNLYPVTSEHINRCISGSKSIYISHIMQALVELGYTDGIFSDLHKQLFHPEYGSCYVPTEYPDVYDVVETIISSGGVAVLAHPNRFDSMELAEQLAEKSLLDGIEYRNSHCPDSSSEEVMELAKKFNLIKTGGSDFHGSYSKVPNPIGTCVTAGNDLDRLFKLSKGRK